MQDPLEVLKASLKEAVAVNGEIKNSRRTIRKTFYVTPEEDRQIAQLRQGVNQSRYFRAKVLGRDTPRPRPMTPQINRQAYAHLAHIRRHIKQAANDINRAVSQGQTPALTPSDLALFKRLDARLIDIQQQLNPANLQRGGSDDWQDSAE